MLLKLTIYFLVFINLLTFTSCFRIYPNYEQIVKTRSKIEPIPFTREKWFDDKGIGVEALWETRPGLARDLIDRNFLIGKSYSEIQHLLGEQEKDKFDNSISYALFYDMGAVNPVYVEYLYINFDENDRVINNEIKIEMMRGHPDYR